MSIYSSTQKQPIDQTEKKDRTPSYEEFMKIYKKLDQKYQNALQKLANQ